ncbi:MAG: PmoA family protein [Chloroflexota bacterium]
MSGPEDAAVPVPIPPAEPRAGRVEVMEEELRFQFLVRGRLVLAYNKGCLRYGDFYKSKPDLDPVLSPSGRRVTTTSAYRYNHHRSIWIGHAKVNGVNVFHDNNPTRPNLGDIVLEQAEAAAQGQVATLSSTNGWVAKDGRRLLTERRTLRFAPGEAAHVLDIESILVASDGPVELGQDAHAYLGVRVADTMDEEDGGQLLNSQGAQGEAGTMRQVAEWVDYSGPVAGQIVGITLMVHPENPESACFTRAYGTMLANPTLLRPLTIRAGDALSQRFRLVIHEGPPQSDALWQLYREFAKSTTSA